MTLRFEGVSFHYGDRAVFRNLSIEVAQGSRVALMGASGSGKTTFLKLAAGLLTPSGGEITPVPVGAAFVFQESRLVPHLTALQNIQLVAPNADAQTLLDQLELGDESDTLPATLSGGMARRVALARALAYTDSELLLLDEPFSGLDERTRQIAADVILARAAGRTIIMSTHDTAETTLLNCKLLRL